VAAIDCGTNSVRLLVADAVRDGGRVPVLRDVHREMRIVRLGQGVDATGRLAAEAIERTGVALADYGDVLRRTGAERVRMVATSAVRDAVNRDEFFASVRATLGIDAELISGDEEARLSFTGAVAELDPGDGPFLVVDLGGGSTELVVGEFDGGRAEVLGARSVDLGCVRITERILLGDPPTAAQVVEARRVAAAAFADAMNAVPVGAANSWVGVAGTMTTLSAVAMDLPAYDPVAIHLSTMSRADVRRVTELLLGMPRSERAALGPMHPGRVDVIAGGALIVDVLAGLLEERAGITQLVVSEHDILDGIARSLARPSG
jgi:exopolyphosphatase/guanosine-5'-triphosphate,3'-diphosphate pyrophosphatase